MILIQRYLTICKFFLLKKRKKYWNELFQVENPVEFYFISRVHIPAIVSLHPQFTLSYHLPPRTISISQVAPLGSAKMLISLSTDRDVDVQNGTIYIYRHARVVKEREGPWRRAPVTRNCGEIHEPDGISPDSWLLAWVTSFISAPGSGVSRVNSASSLEFDGNYLAPLRAADRHRDYLQSRIESRTAFGNRRGI